MSSIAAEGLDQRRPPGAQGTSLARSGGRDGEAGTAVARNAVFLVVGQATTTLLAIVVSAALGRSLGATDFGIFYLLTTMSTFAYVFAEWGQPLFVIREAARDPQRSGELLGTALVLRAAFAVAVIVPAGFIAWALGYGARTTWLAVLMILATLPLFLAQGYGMVFRARDQMGRDAAVSVSNKAIALGLTLPVLAIGAGIPGVILALAVAGVAALAVAVHLHRRLGTPPLRFSSRTARVLFGAGAPILAMTAAASVQPYLDAIILSKLAPAAAVGWFGAAKIVLGTLIAPATILAAASYPRLARASGDTAALRQQVRSALRPMLWLGALAAAGTYLFATAVISLIYGSSGFGPAARILEFFAPGFFLLFIDILFGHIIYASGRGTGFAIAKIVSVAVGTGLNFLLIPWFQRHFSNGGIGVVVAFALSELVVFAGAAFVLRQALDPGTVLDISRALGAAGATVLLFRILPPVPFWAGIPLCLIVFTAASLAVGLMSGRDLSVVRSFVRRRRSETSPAAETARP